MASLQTSILVSSSSSAKVNSAIHLPELATLRFSSPTKIPTSSTKLKIQQFNKFTRTNILLKKVDDDNDDPLLISTPSKRTVQLYAILEAISDRIEMHQNVANQRDNWNTLLLNSTNMITLTAATMAGIAAATGGAGVLPLKVSSALLFSAATGFLLVMNKIQPSQLAEEQRNATRLFKQLHMQIETLIALGSPKEEDVKNAMAQVLALDKAYPLPLLGAMLEKFPAKFEPAVWWPSRNKELSQHDTKKKKMKNIRNNNGWSEELEMELREVIEVVKRKDMEDYERLGNLALKMNKVLAISGPLLTGIAAVGSAFMGNGWMADMVPLVVGSLGAVVNTVEHGGQVGMVVEMYRNCGGFFKMLETWIESTLEEKELEERENGEIFEMKMALRLGRSVSQLRELASKSESCRREGVAVDEFASKLF